MAVALVPGTSAFEARAQSLADYDYENLGFRGVAVEAGYLVPTRVETTHSFGIRIDLGYLGPGLRILPGISYWSSEFKRSEVAEFERKLDTLIARQTDPGETPTTVELGGIDWSDLVMSLDGHVVWDGPLGMLPYVGAGASIHLLNGEGDAVSGTFVEDLLDAVRAGINLQAGLELPIVDQFRIYGGARYEVLGDLQYLEIRVGGQIMIAPPALGEERRSRPEVGGIGGEVGGVGGQVGDGEVGAGEVGAGEPRAAGREPGAAGGEPGAAGGGAHIRGQGGG